MSHSFQATHLTGTQAADTSHPDFGVIRKTSRIDSTMLTTGSSSQSCSSQRNSTASLSPMFSVSGLLTTRGNFHKCSYRLPCAGGYDVYKGPRNLDPAVVSGAQWPVNEPLAVVPAMAAATQSIGFGVTVTTTYEQPYHLARRLSTVDHLTKGRYVLRSLSNFPTANSRFFLTEWAGT